MLVIIADGLMSECVFDMQDSSPQSPTPALVVSGSPSIGNKHNKSSESLYGLTM